MWRIWTNGRIDWQMIKVNGKKIITNTGELLFEKNVMEAVEENDIIVIVLDTDEHRNVYCYTINHQLLWQIEKIPVEIGGTEECTYVSVGLKNGVCRVIDFWGRSFVVDITNGKVISMNIVK